MFRSIAVLLILVPVAAYTQNGLDELCADPDEIQRWSITELREHEEAWEARMVALQSELAAENMSLDQPLFNAKYGLRVQLANCYIFGKGTERDTAKAMALLEEPAAAGHPGARNVLASLKLFRTDDPDLQRQGFETLQEDYEAGSAFAAGRLGWAYQKGVGVDADRDKALELYEHAAERGMTYWQYLLAHAYEKGYLGLQQDSEKAAAWIAYKPKVHIALYECWVASYYGDGTFPANEELQARYQRICDETDVGEWWVRFQSE